MVTSLLDRPAALHPAERRRIAALLPPEPAHEVLLRPLGGGDGRMMIVSVREESFLEAIFADLKADDWRNRLIKRRGVRRGADHFLELGLPTHRHFQLVLFEAVCAMPGFPPVDPRKLVGMGLVLRRVERSGEVRAWMKAGGQPVGWRHVASGLSPQPDPDPDPVLRLPSPNSANGHIAALIAARRGHADPAIETVLPLFVAPPDVCDARRRTIVFGVVPVASSETAGTEKAPDFNRDLSAEEDADITAHLSEYLKQRPKLSLPNAGAALDPKWHVLQTPVAGDVDAGRRNALGVFLYQLQTELGVFEGGVAGRAMLDELARLTLVMQRDGQGRTIRTMLASTWVAAAANVLVGGAANPATLANGQPNPACVRMPLEWPVIDAPTGARLQALARGCMGERFRQLITETPKFDRDERIYTVRGFVRVEGHADCTPALVWSGYSEVFRIVPWWDSDAPAARISLPSISKLKAIKPNVSFEMPPQLANLLKGDMKKLKDGEGEASEFGIGWICSFSIPIITICAFIVLNIFLTLFDIIFFWMAFLKICIPYPKPK